MANHENQRIPPAYPTTFRSCPSRRSLALPTLCAQVPYPKRPRPRAPELSIQFAIANYPSPDTQPEERSSNGASLHLKSHSYTCKLFLWFLLPAKNSF
ncbi:hypothetical protein TWF192_003597 [Orbilia oligospora]|nr:hypothetical protein TWF192_003597 [Orbilia oligospora]